MVAASPVSARLRWQYRLLLLAGLPMAMLSGCSIGTTIGASHMDWLFRAPLGVAALLLVALTVFVWQRARKAYRVVDTVKQVETQEVFGRPKPFVKNILDEGYD